jgi:hypothetical protein
MPTVREHILSLRDQGHDMEFIRGRIKYLTGVDPTNAPRSLLDVEVSEEDVNLAAGADEIKATLSSVERPDREQLRRKVSGTPWLRLCCLRFFRTFPVRYMATRLGHP